MVAYSFKRRFVAPIQVGLGIYMPPEPTSQIPDPKTHTIRALRDGRSRHARAGEPVSLYCDQRSPDGFLIGMAVCIDAPPISLEFKRGLVRSAPFGHIRGAAALDTFARSDGFEDWAQMHAFWREEHDADGFDGIIVRWRRQ